MTGKRSLLTKFEKKAGPVVSFGDGNKGETLGYGSIVLGNVIIENVALVEGLKHTLLSISQLSDKGYQSTFDSEVCVVSNKVTREVVLIGQRHGNIYEASFEDQEKGSITCLYSKASNEESWKWHKRLSHLNFKKLNYLVKHNLVRGLPQVNFVQDGLCDACQLGKQKRTSFKSKTENSITEPFHMLHLDLFGPVNIMSIKRRDMLL